MLIVIIIIGILAGMMVLTSGSAARRAEDTKAVNDVMLIMRQTMLILAENSVSDRNQLFINAQNGKLEVKQQGVKTEKTAAIEKSLKAAFDSDITTKKFSVVYDRKGDFMVLMYYPKKGSYPYYFIGTGDPSDKDMSIYCIDDATSSRRIVKSY